MSQRVLITGGKGRLGRILTSYLKAQGYRVKALGRSDLESPEQSVQVDSGGRLQTLSEKVSEADILLHLASTTSRDQATQRAVHVDLTQQLLEAATATPTARFVYFSSAKAVAGEHAGQPLSVDCEPQPKSDYGRFKRAAEEAIMAHVFNPATQATILRLPMVYGPGCSGNFDRLARLVRRGVPVPLARNNVRSVLFTENLCAYIGALLATPENPVVGAGPKPVNTIHLADPEPLSSARLTQLMADQGNRPNRCVPLPQKLGLMAGYLPLVGGYAMRLFGSLELDTCSLGNWAAPYTTPQGVTLTLDQTIG